MSAEVLAMSPATRPQPGLVTPAHANACLQSLNTGVAVADAASWAIVYENDTFAQWFALEDNPDGLASLTARLPQFDVKSARSRLENGRPYKFESEIKAGVRNVSLVIELRYETVCGMPQLLVECQDISKQKQSEYMLESYSHLAEKNARELTREKERVERLLLNVMPRSVYEEMKDYGTAMPQRFDDASVLMLDFVGFTEMAISHDPGALVAELNDIFTSFDRIVEHFDCERIKTIGDAYMAVSGLPESNPEHASNLARVALRMCRYLTKRNAANPNRWQCRIGIGSGPVIGSLIGIQKYVYDIFGPAVNLAARLEALSEPMLITVAAETAEALQDEFLLRLRGEFEVKGFGELALFALEGELER